MATLDVLTLAEAKSALNLTNSTAHDAELPGWITAVSKRLDRLIGPVVRRTISSEKHDGGCCRIYLGKHPITSVTSVTEYAGTVATVLGEESNASKPASGYLLDRYEYDPALYSNKLRRRSGGVDTYFAAGGNNVEVTYVPGRFLDTASVEEDFKEAAGLMLINLWRSQEDSSGQVGEFDVPQSNFPTFAVPRAVRQMFDGEIQDPLFL